MRHPGTTVGVLLLALLMPGGALAKDRPPKPEPDKPVTGCEYLGRDYVKAPGSDTCIKISGSSRTEGAVILGR